MRAIDPEDVKEPDRLEQAHRWAGEVDGEERVKVASAQDHEPHRQHDTRANEPLHAHGVLEEVAVPGPARSL